MTELISINKEINNYKPCDPFCFIFKDINTITLQIKRILKSLKISYEQKHKLFKCKQSLPNNNVLTFTINPKNIGSSKLNPNSSKTTLLDVNKSLYNIEMNKTYGDNVKFLSISRNILLKLSKIEDN